MSSTYCDVCDLDIRGSEERFERHVSGKKHQAKLKGSSGGRKVALKSPRQKTKAKPATKRPKRGAKRAQAEEEDASNYCEVCDVTVTNERAWKRHLSGKKHKGKMDMDDEGAQAEEEDASNYCELCDVTATNEKAWKRHLSGKKHKGKMNDEGAQAGEEDASNYCELCDVTATNERAWKRHLSGKKHKGKMDMDDEAMDVDTDEKVIGASAKVENHCEVCDVRTYGEFGWETHLNGKKHAAAVKRADMDAGEETNYCGMCNVYVVGTAKWTAHIKGSKHAETLESLSTYCEDCDLNVLGEPQWASHLKGKKHLRNTGGTREAGDESNYCEACKKDVNGGDHQWDRHLSGRKHLSMMKKLTAQ